MGSQILQWIEFTVGVVGLIFGIFEHFKRQKIERVLRTITQTYPGDVAKIEQSCVWAWANAENVLRNAEGRRYVLSTRDDGNDSR